MRLGIIAVCTEVYSPCPCRAGVFKNTWKLPTRQRSLSMHNSIAVAKVAIAVQAMQEPVLSYNVADHICDGAV